MGRGRREAAAGLRAALEEVAAVDQHAHLLSGPGTQWSLLELLSESSEPGQQAEVRHHPAFRRALRDLGTFLDLGVEADEEAIAAAASKLGFEAHSRGLLRACHLETLLVDDGYPVPGALGLDGQGDLAGCPARRVVRIETVAEEAASGWPTFGTLRDRFRHAVSDALEGEAAALKTIAAYRFGLDLPRPDTSEAEAAYATWRREAQPGNSPLRLTHPALIAFFLAEGLEMAVPRPVPLQIHTGLGDADLALHRADPSLLGPLIEDAAAVSVPVVLLHCYPFVRQAAWLASVHGHVFLDLSLGLLLAGHRGPAIVLEALELAPASKLVFASDASRAAEMFFLAARWWRDALAGALGELVTGGDIEERVALAWGERILATNARRLYGL
jgi:uncharacterized protein